MSIAFIVDGFLEKKVVQRLCKGAPIRMTNFNGRDVSVDALSKAVSSLITWLQGNNFPIVVITDREERAASAENLENEIRRRLIEFGHRGQDIVVSVSDRMIENWILSGVLMPDEFRDQYNGNCDGCNGKRHLKEVCRKRGFNYDETVIGVELFCSMDLFLASSRSPSFERFATYMKTYCPQFRRS
jgi:hypothetical protein